LRADQRRLILAERLVRQIQYFGNRDDALPEWREAARVTDIEEFWRLWPGLPIVDKQMLRSRFQPEEMQRRFRIEGRASSTGGSTGEPTPYLHDRAMQRHTTAQVAYARLRMGWSPGLPTMVIWGSERDIGKQTALRARLHNRLLNVFMIEGYKLDQQTVERLVAMIRKHRPVAIYGFTSMLEFVARTALESKLTPAAGDVKTAWNGGEMLFDEQSLIFRRAFGVPILNCYGGREVSVMAFQEKEGAPLQILRPWLFAEIVGDNGKPVSPGEAGRLLWTSTICRGTPFIRYDIGDLASYDSVHEDESGIVSLQTLHGRVAGLLGLPNGMKISCLYWNHLFKEFSEVHQFQVALKKGEEIELRLKGKGFAPLREAQMRVLLRNFLGPLPVRIQWMEKIPLTAQGKLVQVVRED
jgi:phenylacetate-CoA ligase